MDIFQKCYEPSLAKELKAAGVYPYFHALQSRQDVEVMMEGKRRIMLGSNNYLGLTTAPDVVEAGIHAGDITDAKTITALYRALPFIRRESAR